MTIQTLDLDVGNSHTKWRIGSRSGRLVSGTFPLSNDEIRRVRVATVAGSEEKLSKQISKTYRVQPEFARTTKMLAGVRNGYEDFTQLGVDRWLALVAAWDQARCDLLVFDFGTAMTADFVREDGSHLGGYIVPGLSTMRMTLGQNTRDVRVLSDRSELARSSRPARNTNDAVNNGLAQVQLGWVKSCIEVGVQIFGTEPRLILTGGDVKYLLECPSIPFHFVSELVLDGLAIALP